MVATLARQRKLDGPATRRKHFSLEKHANWLLALIAKQPDLTLDEVLAAMRKRRIAGSRTALWRFFARHKISFKKKPACGRAGTSGRGASAPALDSRARHA